MKLLKLSKKYSLFLYATIFQFAKNFLTETEDDHLKEKIEKSVATIEVKRNTFLLS